MNRLIDIEKEYLLKLQEAKKEEDYGKIQILLFELKTLRKINMKNYDKIKIKKDRK